MYTQTSARIIQFHVKSDKIYALGSDGSLWFGVYSTQEAKWNWETVNTPYSPY